MDAIGLINNYVLFLEEISRVIKPELLPVIDQMKDIDPHDLVQPNTFFLNEDHARGFVWNIFLTRAKKYS